MNLNQTSHINIVVTKVGQEVGTLQIPTHLLTFQSLSTNRKPQIINMKEYSSLDWMRANPQLSRSLAQLSSTAWIPPHEPSRHSFPLPLVHNNSSVPWLLTQAACSIYSIQCAVVTYPSYHNRISRTHKRIPPKGKGKQIYRNAIACGSLSLLFAIQILDSRFFSIAGLNPEKNTHTQVHSHTHSHSKHTQQDGGNTFIWKSYSDSRHSPRPFQGQLTRMITPALPAMLGS